MMMMMFKLVSSLTFQITFRDRAPSFYKQTLPLPFAISQYNYSSLPKNTRTSIKSHSILPLVW